MSDHTAEVLQGSRFEFGKNWRRFLSVLDENRITQARESLKEMLQEDDLSGKAFLDAGSGSGLFSLAARSLGAAVHSFDYDPQSVACTNEIKRRYRLDDPMWTVAEGSVLDKAYLKSLGEFDIVYSWGVLHHTGQMWSALDNICSKVAPGGKLFIAIYNDQGLSSRAWGWVKWAYNRLPASFKFLVLWPAFIRLWGLVTLRDLLRGQPFHTWGNYSSERGMSPWYDVLDWVGGYPFEYAKPEAIIDFYTKHGFVLQKTRIRGGYAGCNEFVFQNQYPETT